VAGAPARGPGPLTLAGLSGGSRPPALNTRAVLMRGQVRRALGGLSVVDARGRTLDSWLGADDEERAEPRRRFAVAVYPLKVPGSLLQPGRAERSDGRRERDGLGFAGRGSRATRSSPERLAHGCANS